MTKHPNELPFDKDVSHGVCPHCGDYDFYVNVYKNHVFVCKRHKTAWVAGVNIFSSWCEESEAEWHANSDWLKSFTFVEPTFPDLSKGEDDMKTQRTQNPRDSVDNSVDAIATTMVGLWKQGFREDAFHEYVSHLHPKALVRDYRAAEEKAHDMYRREVAEFAAYCAGSCHGDHSPEAAAAWSNVMLKGYYYGWYEAQFERDLQERAARKAEARDDAIPF